MGPDQPDFPDEDAFRFRHLLIRDTAYESLPKAERADLHRRFADWLEQKVEEAALANTRRSSGTTWSRRTGTEQSSESRTASSVAEPDAAARGGRTESAQPHGRAGRREPVGARGRPRPRKRRRPARPTGLTGRCALRRGPTRALRGGPDRSDESLEGSRRQAHRSPRATRVQPLARADRSELAVFGGTGRRSRDCEDLRGARRSSRRDPGVVLGRPLRLLELPMRPSGIRVRTDGRTRDTRLGRARNDAGPPGGSSPHW